MKHLLAVASFALVLTACTDTTGLSKDSSRPPKGDPNAVVVVKEYADLQCPACKMAHESVVKPVLEKYGDKIRYEFHHFPLRSIHRFALDAAEASECAADQGKFWEFVDLAFEKQAELSFEALTAWGEQLQLDAALFDRCWKSKIKRDTVLADYDEGKALGVMGTPSFFVQGKKLDQNGFDTLGAAIEEALKGSTMPL